MTVRKITTLPCLIVRRCRIAPAWECGIFVFRSFILYNDCYKFAGLNLVRNNNRYDHESDNQENHEKFLITYYFFRGFSYKEILLFLEAQYNHVISYRTLLHRLEQYTL